MTVYETLTVERNEHVLRVGLNRPDKRNAFNLQMLEELAEAYQTFEDDHGLRCLALVAHGDHFTGGLDLAEVGPAVASGRSLSPAEGVDPLDLHGRRRTKPVVCGVQGWCLTIGVELLLAADIRVAASDTRFAQMEVRRGIMPFGGATLRLPQIAGWGNAMRWLLTGEEFEPEEALRIGLIQEVVSPDRVHQRTFELAAQVAAQAPLAVQASRESARISVEEGWEAARERLMGQTRELMNSEDALEGMRSFMERRDGKFQGR